jgi:hypothetical protein
VEDTRREFDLGPDLGANRLTFRSKNVARAWTNETSVMCGIEKLDENLPDNQ